MDLVVAFVSALLGLTVAFFLSISFYDLLPQHFQRHRIAEPAAQRQQQDRQGQDQNAHGGILVGQY